MQLSTEFLHPGGELNTEANTPRATQQKDFASNSCLDLFLAIAQTPSLVPLSPALKFV